jgi:hypothetical protein
MQTEKYLLSRHCIRLNLSKSRPFRFRPNPGASSWAAAMTAIGYLAFSPLTLAHGGGHMSGPNNPGSPSHQEWHHEGRYWDPFWGSWYPGYVGAYDSNYSYAPTPAQATTAQKRVKDYLVAVQKGRRRAATHRYIAVETLRPTKKQLEDYAKKQADAKSAAATGSAQMSNRWVPPSQLRCVMVFDTQSKQFVGSGCYVIANPPSIGTVAKFDTYSAEFVGTQAL